MKKILFKIRISEKNIFIKRVLHYAIYMVIDPHFGMPPNKAPLA